MPDGVVKVQKNKNITLPAWLMRRFRVEAGDYLLLQETENGVLLKPAKLVDPSQAYFWTKEWQSRGRKPGGRRHSARPRKAI